MKLRELVPVVAVLATGMTTAGLALPLTAADAAVPAHHSAAHAAASHGTKISASKLTQVRTQQRQMLAASKTAPTVSKAGTKTFTVNTTEDSDLANPTGTTCVDAATAKCSLRAAVDAANNLAKPVKIVLGKHTYTLSSATELTVTNPAGTSIVGAGAGNTAIHGAGSRVFYVTQSGATGAADPLLFLTALKVTGGSASDGAGIYLNYISFAATLVLDGVVISGNTATNDGGGLYTGNYSTIYANNSTFSNNVAMKGGGLFTDWANVNFTGVKITGNHTPTGVSGGGAGWYNEYGVNRMKGGSISGNTAGDSTHSGYAGGLYDEYGNTAFTNVHLDNNTANDDGYGGAIEAYYNLLQITGGTMSHNKATGQYSEGGALYIDYGAQVDIHGVAMVGNKVDVTNEDSYGGGTIYLYGDDYGNQLNITGSTISGSNGGAIYAYADYGQADITISGSTFTGNKNTATNGYSSYGCGGAVCAYAYEYGGVNLSMTGNKLIGNTSTSSGDYGSGAVSIYAYYYAEATATFKGNLFEKNVAGVYGLGGAIGAFSYGSDYSPISIHSQSNRFIANKAGTSGGYGLGGAVGLYYYSAFTDQGSTFANNRAIGDGAEGGAYYSDSDQSSRFTGTKFTGNAAGPATGGNGYGGAIYTEDEAGTTLSKVTVSGNTASSYGGGIYTDSSAYSVSVEQSTISGNTAGNSTSNGYGGGIYSYEAVLSLENTTVANNRARGEGYGGGIYAYDGATFGLRYSTVSGNLAKTGGGIYSYTSEPGETLLSSIVSGNHKAPHGAESDCSFAGPDEIFHSLGGNVIGQRSCVTATRANDKVTTHAGLGALKSNGGPTKTMALSSKSPAIGRAAFQIPSTDQRGHKRPAKHADAGAYER